MPKFLCLRKCWSDFEKQGVHIVYEEGEIYTFDKGVEPPRHFVQVKANEDGVVEVVGKVTPKKGKPVDAARDLAQAKAVVEKVTSKPLDNGKIEKGE